MGKTEKKKAKKPDVIIRKPKGAARIFLLIAIGFFIASFGSIIMPILTEEAKQHSTLEIISDFAHGVSVLFISIVLFNKKYDKMVIFSSFVLLVVNTFTISKINILNISNIIFYILLAGFAYVMINMQESPIRETFAKIRFIIPIYNLLILVFSLIDTIKTLSASLVENTGAQLSESLSRAAVILPALMFLPAGILMVIAYAMLVNWLADPYEKK